MTRRRQLLRLGGASFGIIFIIIQWIAATKSLHQKPPVFLGIELVTAVALLMSALLFFVIGATTLIEVRSPSVSKRLFWGATIVLGLFIAVTIVSVGVLLVVPLLLIILSGREDTQPEGQNSTR